MQAIVQCKRDEYEIARAVLRFSTPVLSTYRKVVALLHYSGAQKV
jgi:RNase P/RNase MRP subunit POP5